MALDGIYFHSITREIADSLLESKLDKIAQPNESTLLLTFRGRGLNRKLLLSAHSTYARLHFTTLPRENPMKAPMFLMVLRKHLLGARLIQVEQPGCDRLVNLRFKAYTELGDEEIFVLSTEMMGRHSNILLVRERDNVLLDCIKHVSSMKNSYRTLLPGKPYVPPPPSTGLDPRNYSDQDLNARVDLDTMEDTLFMRAFTGISRKTALRLARQWTGEPLLGYIRTKLQAMTEATSFYVLREDGQYLDVVNYPFPGEKDTFSSPSEALETYVREKDLKDRIRGKSTDLQRIVTTNIDRVKKKIEVLERSIEDSADKDHYRLLGELLSANAYAVQEGMEEITVQNYYTDALTTIRLNPQKNISQNIDAYYQKYKKKKRAEVMARGQQILAREELDYLTSILLSLENLEEEHEVKDIRQELIVAGYLRFRKGPSSKEKPSKPLHFQSTEGVDIYVGKNNTQNDYLTTKFAQRTDTWLHTKNIPGSHVIIRGDRFNEETLLEAANLAAYYSKAQQSSKVPVDYTEIRHVKKPSGSKPGMVIYSTNKTLYVDPAPPRLPRLD